MFSLYQQQRPAIKGLILNYAYLDSVVMGLYSIQSIIKSMKNNIIKVASVHVN